MLHTPTGAVRFGLTLANRGVLLGICKPSDLLEMAETAEASGLFSHVWVGDSLMAIPRMESLTLLGALAGRTRKVRLGVACMASLPARDPVVLAYQWASLDVLSGGRMTLAACMGGRRQTEAQIAENQNTGVKAADRAQRLEEHIAILRKLWTEDRVTYQGKFHTLQNASILPKPVQNPAPIWVVSSPRLKIAKPHIVERSLRRVASMGDGWMTTAWIDYPGVMEEFAELRRRIFEYATEYGKDTASFPCAVYYFINVNEDREAAYQESKKFLEQYYSTQFSRQAVENWVAMGAPEECVERLRSLIRVGFTDILLGLPTWDPKGQLQRCIEEVLPRLT